MENTPFNRSSAILLGVTIGVVPGFALDNNAIGIDVGVAFAADFITRSREEGDQEE
jgi:hypothetical protein